MQSVILITHPRCHRHTLSQLILSRHVTYKAPSKHPFPFPKGANPTPHEIFHLPSDASQDEIKTRYYELVKLYHPDMSKGQYEAAPSVRNARFRAITHAYGLLHHQRGRNDPGPNGAVRPWDHYESCGEAMRAELRRRSRRSPSSTASAVDSSRHANTSDAQLWYTLTAFVLAGMIAAMGSFSSHMDRVERHTQSAAANLAQARAEAQIYGAERRKKIRERVRAYNEARETVREARTRHTQAGELARGETGPKCA